MLLVRGTGHHHRQALARVASRRPRLVAMSDRGCDPLAVANDHGCPTWGSSRLWLAGLGLVHTGLLYALMYVGIGKLPASPTAVLQFAYPTIVVTIHWAYFGTRTDRMQLLGVGVMAGAILRAGREPPPRVTARLAR